jgi:hypothetical protein
VRVQAAGAVWKKGEGYMDEQEFFKWLINNGHAENTARSRTANCKRVCEYEGDLDKLYKADHCQNLLNRLKYTSEDQAHNRRALHAVPIEGNIYNGTATLRSAVNLYIEFLKNRNTTTSSGKQQSNVQPNHLLSEYEAIQICRNNGLPITEYKNFASKNTRAPVYWTNPIIDRLRHDWWLILNDDIRCILYVFCIPANTIPQQQVRLRNDNQNLMDIKIQYDDPSFKDTRSSIRFKPWLRMKIPYSNLFNGNQRQEEIAPQSSVQEEVPEPEQPMKDNDFQKLLQNIDTVLKGKSLTAGQTLKLIKRFFENIDINDKL